MKPYRRILHPTDLSPHCPEAFAHALKIALSSKDYPEGRSGLEILHCADPDESDFRHFPRVRQRLIRWGVLPDGASQQDVVDFGLDVRKQVSWGEPSQEIAREVEEMGADLLVMASHARGGWSRFLQDSVSSHAVQESHIAGLLLPKGVGGFVNSDSGEVQLQRILIPVAPEPDAWPALEAAVRLLHTLGSSVQGGEILQVHAGLEADFPAGKCPPAPAGWEWARRLLAGKPVDAIADLAAEWQPQLAVMASQGRDSWKDRWFGSTLEKLLGRLHCPILVVPAYLED